MNEGINLKWNNYSLTLLNNLRKFQNKESLCDSTLTCHGKFYPVHRLVLSLCSEYFENIFDKTPCKHPFLIINDIEPTELESLLNFLYQGEVLVSQENLPKFLKAAEYLKIKGLISDINSKKTHALFNSITDFDSNKSEDRKANIRINNVSHEVTNMSKRSPIIVDPLIPIEKLKLFSNYKLKKPTKIKKEKDFDSKSCRADIKKKQAKELKKVKCDKIKVNSSKVIKEPVRMSPRKLNSLVDYTIPDESDFDENMTSNNESLKFIEDDRMPQITISSYSGGNDEEFNSIRNSTYLESEDSIAVKVELTEYSVDDNSFNMDFCGVKSEATSKNDERLLNGSIDLPGSSFEENISDEENVDIDESFGCKTFGDLLENFNKSVSSEIKPFYEDAEEICKTKVICSAAEKILATPDNNGLTKKKLFSCKFCLYSAFSKSKFQKHMMLSHKSFNTLKKCQFCPYISRESYMIPHEIAHAHKTSFKCQFCWYRSIRKKNLTAHQKLHFVSSTQIRKNKNCMKTKAIKKHKLKRTKPLAACLKQKSSSLQCKYCPYKAKYAAHVRAHERIHTGNLLKCQFCSFATSFQTVMTKHESAHQSLPCDLGSKKDVYTCDHCPYSAVRKPSVLRHLKCHVLRKVYNCNKCTYSTDGAKQIRMHELLHSYSEDVK